MMDHLSMVSKQMKSQVGSLPQDMKKLGNRHMEQLGQYKWSHTTNDEIPRFKFCYSTSNLVLVWKGSLPSGSKSWDDLSWTIPPSAENSG